jgi:hypothetical protein
MLIGEVGSAESVGRNFDQLIVPVSAVVFVAGFGQVIGSDSGDVAALFGFFTLNAGTTLSATWMPEIAVPVPFCSVKVYESSVPVPVPVTEPVF